MNRCRELQYPDLFNAIPMPVFIVDDRIRILDSNTAAQRSFGRSNFTIRSPNGDQVLNCLSLQDQAGCGNLPACEHCIIRKSVLDSLLAGAVIRHPMKFETGPEGQKKELELLITASPLPGTPGTDEKTVLLIVEDITEFHKLKTIVSICSYCKRVRNEADFWQQVEGYFHEHIGMDFSHGICPECMQKHYGAYIDSIEKRLGE